MFVAGSPDYYAVECDTPLVGRAGNIFGAALNAAGIDRSSARIIYAVPVRAPNDEFAQHDQRDVEWGIERMRIELAKTTNAKVYVALGEEALNQLTALRGIGNWRGSQLHVGTMRRHTSESKEDFLPLAGAAPRPELNHSAYVVPTYSPVAVAKQFAWHPLSILDFGKVKKLLAGEAPTVPVREWYFNNPTKLAELADRLKRPHEHSGVIAIDTEQRPTLIVGIATEDEVHVFQWHEAYRAALEEILCSPFVIKVAHNLAHDWTFFVKVLKMNVALPWFDTMGGAQVLNNALDKSLSPDISTRFTNWPYHKWMGEIDAMWYNGLDNAVTYDAYMPMLQELIKRGLYDVAKHDHALLPPLLDMQWYGFKVDAKERAAASAELLTELTTMTAALSAEVAPIVDKRLNKFQKPHLFEVERKCAHCGGGKTQAAHCWRCAGLEAEPKRKADYQPLCYMQAPAGELVACSKKKTADLRAMMPVCSVCAGTGKVKKRLEFNPESADQVADVLYRGLGIRPRKYKGVETVRVGQLEPLAGEYPLVARLVDYARTNADFETVERLSAGDDGRLHCVFDPFGTDSGRVASKEGLIEKGTNAMNIPKKARRLVVPDEGYVFLYPDMAQVEARAIAATTKDKSLIEAFNDPATDMHVLVRDDMRRVGVDAFSRDQAKRLEFASFYGGRAEQVARELTDEAYRKAEGVAVNKDQTELMMNTLLNGRFAAVSRWHRRVEENLLQSRKVVSITGREMFFPGEIYDRKTKGIQYEILKQAWSREPQDVGAWILADGMLDLWNNHWNKVRGLIHVHDALLLMAREEDVEEASDIIVKVMSREKWGVKFPAQVKVGKNWYQAS